VAVYEERAYVLLNLTYIHTSELTYLAVILDFSGKNQKSPRTSLDLGVRGEVRELGLGLGLGLGVAGVRSEVEAKNLGVRLELGI
jgi:hypothetical protein